MLPKLLIGFVVASCASATSSRDGQIPIEGWDPDKVPIATPPPTTEPVPPKQNPLAFCKGDHRTWDAGNGACESYEELSRDWCWTDKQVKATGGGILENNGLYAYEVCSECRWCRDKEPEKDVPHVCAWRTGERCSCHGDVFIGRKYKIGNSGETTTFEEMTSDKRGLAWLSKSDMSSTGSIYYSCSNGMCPYTAEFTPTILKGIEKWCWCVPAKSGLAREFMPEYDERTEGQCPYGSLDKKQCSLLAASRKDPDHNLHRRRIGTQFRGAPRGRDRYGKLDPEKASCAPPGCHEYWDYREPKTGPDSKKDYYWGYSNTGSCSKKKPCFCKPCLENHVRWFQAEPLTVPPREISESMPETKRSKEASSEKCQQRCASVSGCAHFTFKKDGGCTLTNATATSTRSIDTKAGAPKCLESGSPPKKRNPSKEKESPSKKNPPSRPSPGDPHHPTKPGNCWSPCHNKPGKCEWCGKDYACCRRDWAKDPAICKLGRRFMTGHHECVKVAGFDSPAPPPVTTPAPLPPKFSNGCGAPPDQSRKPGETCFHSDQCTKDSYCCPYLKHCVNHKDKACYEPIAKCSPRCPDHKCEKQAGCPECKCSKVGDGKKWDWIAWANLENSNSLKGPASPTAKVCKKSPRQGGSGKKPTPPAEEEPSKDKPPTEEPPKAQRRRGRRGKGKGGKGKGGKGRPRTTPIADPEATKKPEMTKKPQVPATKR